MDAYIILLIGVFLVIILQELYGEINLFIVKYKINIIPFLLYATFVVFFSIRYRIGYDYIMYEKIINNDLATLVYGDHGEIVSAFLMNVATKVDCSEVFFFIVAVIAFYGIIKSIFGCIDNGLKGSWAFLMFLAVPIGFTEALSIQRQFLATGIVMWGVKYILQQNRMKYFAVIMLATLCHVASSVYFLLYLAVWEKLTVKKLVCISIIGFVIIQQLLIYIGSMFPKYLTYIESNTGLEVGGSGQLFIFVFIALIGCIMRKYMHQWEKYDVFLKMYLMGVCFLIWFAPVGVKISVRLGGVALYMAMFLLPYWFSAFRFKDRLLVKICVAIALSYLYFYSLSVTDGNAYVPFQTIFD